MVKIPSIGCPGIQYNPTKLKRRPVLTILSMLLLKWPNWRLNKRTKPPQRQQPKPFWRPVSGISACCQRMPDFCAPALARWLCCLTIRPSLPLTRQLPAGPDRQFRPAVRTGAECRNRRPGRNRLAGAASSSS
uniref:Uncharacterized protein n=1 Tax=Macrostomum lignano TaxID=282301 RepID=A0A1I8HV82_9PLAT